jgi:hypothetical protein
MHRPTATQRDKKGENRRKEKRKNRMWRTKVKRKATDSLWGPPSLLSNWYWGALSPGVKWPGRETDHLPPSTSEIKNGGAY